MTATTTTTEYTSLTQWYDSQDEQYQDLYDAIIDRIPYADKWDVDQVIDFISELDDLGIETSSQFEDAYYGHHDDYKAEATFAEEFYEGMMSNAAKEELAIPLYYVDWQRVWDHSLSYDFSTIEFDGDTFFFNNNF